jgi:hypothetical protein
MTRIFRSACDWEDLWRAACVICRRPKAKTHAEDDEQDAVEQSALDGSARFPHHPSRRTRCGGNNLAISAPDHIGVACDLLAHSDLRTTIKYYNRATGIEASRAYSQVIAGMGRKQNRRSS